MTKNSFIAAIECAVDDFAIMDHYFRLLLLFYSLLYTDARDLHCTEAVFLFRTHFLDVFSFVRLGCYYKLVFDITRVIGIREKN